MKKYLLTVSFILCSCAGLGPAPEASIDSVNSDLSYSKICCNKISDMTFETFQFKKPETFRIDKTSGSYNFSTGKSFYKAINLKQIDGNKTLILRSYFIRGGQHYFKNGYVFKPTVQILDNKMNIIRTISPDVFTFHHADSFGENNRLEGEFKVNSDLDKFLIISTTDVELLSTTEATIAQGSVYGEFRNTYQISHSPVGSFKLELK
ncbi:MalM family protein [Methylovorus sp. MP688]|uniref:MalM family protein n=1 Tax=Methylovorus sp. (strain MP688) TaxID=887061 RepID=UPI000A004F2F|nr:MalM family protein [Methylovorus sp. MP688]